MADPSITRTPRQNLSVSPARSLSIPVGNIQRNLSGISRALDNISGTAQEFHKRKVIKESKEVGAAAGLEENLELREGVTLADMAFNASASDIFLNKLLLSTSVGLDNIARDNPGDPVAIKAAGDAQELAIISSIPDELVPGFILAHRDKLNIKIAQARDDQLKNEIDEHTAVFLDTEEQLLTDLEESAIFGDDAAILTNLELYIGLIERNGPIDNGGTGVFTETQQAARIISARKVAEKNIIIGQFRDVSLGDKPEFLSLLLEEEEFDKLIGGDSVFSPSEVKQIQDELYSEYVRESQLRIENGKADLQALKDEASVAEIEFYLDPSEKNFRKLIELKTLTSDATNTKAILDYFRGAAFEIDARVVNELKQGIIEDEIVSFFQIQKFIGNGLDVDTALKLRETLINKQTADTTFVDLAEWKEALRRLDSIFQIQRDGFGFISSLSNQQTIDNRNAIHQSIWDTVRVKWSAFVAGAEEKPDILGILRKEIERFNKNEEAKRKLEESVVK